MSEQGLATSADLRTSVNQIQSLLLLLDSTSDLTVPTSTSGEEAVSPGAGAPGEKLVADDASESSDAPLMQQQQPQQQEPKQDLAALASQPGLSQMLPALLLPLQPATPVLLAQLNLSSVAMGFPNTAARYRGAVQHAFNLVGDLHRGIQMLSNPMPDPANPGRTREAPLSLAARLMRDTPPDKLKERIETIRKRQKASQPTKQEPQETLPPPAPTSPKSSEDVFVELPFQLETDSLDAYLSLMERHMSNSHEQVRLLQPRKNIVQMETASMTVFIAFTHSDPVTVYNVVVRSATERATVYATGTGLAPLLRPSRYPKYQSLGSQILARIPATRVRHMFGQIGAAVHYAKLLETEFM